MPNLRRPLKHKKKGKKISGWGPKNKWAKTYSYIFRKKFPVKANLDSRNMMHLT